MRILVTGHNGYIGTVMTPMLLEAGYDVAGAFAVGKGHAGQVAGGVVALLVGDDQENVRRLFARSSRDSELRSME